MIRTNFSGLRSTSSIKSKQPTDPNLKKSDFLVQTLNPHQKIFDALKDQIGKNVRFKAKDDDSTTIERMSQAQILPNLESQSNSPPSPLHSPRNLVNESLETHEAQAASEETTPIDDMSHAQILPDPEPLLSPEKSPLHPPRNLVNESLETHKAQAASEEINFIDDMSRAQILPDPAPLLSPEKSPFHSPRAGLDNSHLFSDDDFAHISRSSSETDLSQQKTESIRARDDMNRSQILQPISSQEDLFGLTHTNEQTLKSPSFLKAPSQALPPENVVHQEAWKLIPQPWIKNTFTVREQEELISGRLWGSAGSKQKSSNEWETNKTIEIFCDEVTSGFKMIKLKNAIGNSVLKAFSLSSDQTKLSLTLHSKEDESKITKYFSECGANQMTVKNQVIFWTDMKSILLVLDILSFHHELDASFTSICKLLKE